MTSIEKTSRQIPEVDLLSFRAAIEKDPVYIVSHPLHDVKISDLQTLIQFFPQNSQELLEYVQKAENEARKSVRSVTQIHQVSRDFENTFYTLDAAETLLYSKRRVVESIAKLHTDPTFRSAAKQCKDQLVALSLNLFYDKSLYQIYLDAYQNIKSSDKSLSHEKEAYLEWKMLSLRKEGLHLEGDEYVQAQALKLEIGRLESLFLQNIDEDSSFILASSEDLVGVPDSVIHSMQQENSHLKKVTCQYPHYFPVMRYCKVETTRKSLYLAFENRAAKENMPILQKIIEKREKFAHLAGFASFAHLDISDQLAETPEAVEEFITSAKNGIKNKYNSEIENLTKSLPEDVFLDDKGQIKPWDLMYLQECYKKEHHLVDEIALQQYFPFKRTFEKIMKMFGEMFSLEIEFLDTQDKGLWNNPGWVISVKNAGYIIVDPFPRDGKFPHGYCFDILSPCRLPSGEVNPAIVLLMLNFTPPTDKRESLLRHDELILLLHELGHAFHQLLGNAEMTSRSGYHVQGDALEWPSRLVEFLAWEKKTLQFLGQHYETDSPIPEELIEAKIASKNSTSGLSFMKFFASSLFALKCYSGDVKSTKVLRESIEKDFLQGIYCDPKGNREASFLHLAEHFYRSKFYVYFWADVFACDTYDHITDLLQKGVSDAWLQFRKQVLDHGGGLDPDAAALQFLGRAPRIETYLKKITGDPKKEES